MRSVLVTPPSAEPVSLAEAKLWLKVDHSDEDALIASLVTAARQSAEDYTRRAFVTQTWRLSVDARSGGRVPDWLPAGTYDLPVTYFDGDIAPSLTLPRQPVQSVTGINTYGIDNAATVFDPANYYLDGSRLALTDRWPSGLRGYGAAEITYTAGYGNPSAVPEPIKTALKMHAQAMYDIRTACDLPAGCAQLLRQYRVMDV